MFANIILGIILFILINYIIFKLTKDYYRTDIDELEYELEICKFSNKFLDKFVKKVEKELNECDKKRKENKEFILDLSEQLSDYLTQKEIDEIIFNIENKKETGFKNKKIIKKKTKQTTKNKIKKTKKK